jgi:hypothetical protein
LTASADKIRAKRARRPIYLTCMRVAVLETGEERLAWVASHPIDARLMKERGWRAGDEARGELKKSRNVKFHRLAHAVGNLLVDNVEEFRALNGHDALKQVQQRSGVCCEPIEIDLGALGKVQAQIARSIAFDEMDEQEFGEFFRGICDYIDQHFASVMTDEIRAEYFLMVEGEQRRAA